MYGMDGEASHHVAVQHCGVNVERNKESVRELRKFNVPRVTWNPGVTTSGSEQQTVDACNGILVPVGSV